MKKISVRGARVHNLQDVDIDIPRDKLVVLTGLSGSGKSSLAFDTIYAEGQRRYVESLSAYARQFLGQMEKPDVDSIEGLSPAISIDQKTTSKNPRSTVGTVTEIHDYLRLLWARVGTPHCPRCNTVLEKQSQEVIARSISKFKDEVVLLAPLIDGRKGEHVQILEDLRQKGWSRVEIDQTIYRLDDLPRLDKNKKHTIHLVIDRLRPEGQRLRESLRTGLEEGGGKIEVLAENRRTVYTETGACPRCGSSAPEQEPRLFSFNSPYGACEECHGLGYKEVVDPELLLADQSLSIEEGVLEPFTQNASRVAKKLLEDVLQEYRVPRKKAWRDIALSKRQKILYGDNRSRNVSVRSRFGGQREYKDVRFRGVLQSLENKYSGTSSEWKKERIAQLMSSQPCPACLGARLRPEALAVTISQKNIHEVSSWPVDEILRWFEDLSLSKKQTKIARMLLREIRERLRFLNNVGLYYLSLDRSARTLSGGEAQRIRLATQIGSALSGVLYVLDEPSIGLHQRDNDKLLRTLHNLRDLGNSVLLVEHDEATMLQADWIIDLGPGAGEHGGQVVAQGTPRQIQRSRSLTGKFLAGKETIPVPEKRRTGKHQLVLREASSHNLQNVNLSIPLGTQTCLTGVSGSGKSTLLGSTLYPALQNRLQGGRRPTGTYKSIQGIEHLQKVVEINQAPIGRTPRSNPATYTGIFDHIRALWAQTPESRSRGYKPGRFSFNVRGGRCETCQGDGQLRIEMHFLPDVFVPCGECSGRRYNRETLEVLYRKKSIADVLEMSVEEALQFFSKHPKISRRLQTLYDVGLGYIRLGQPATELSGGEAQRVKLASELSRTSRGDTLYILDEPTTGLHFEDVRRLLDVLQRLVDAGNSVVLIEHNLDVISASDWIIDLGPEGGRDGGKIVAEGTPEEVAQTNSHTGRYLREHLRRFS